MLTVKNVKCFKVTTMWNMFLHVECTETDM